MHAIDTEGDATHRRSQRRVRLRGSIIKHDIVYRSPQIEAPDHSKRVNLLSF